MTDTLSSHNQYRQHVFQIKHWQINPLESTIASSDKTVKVPHNVMQLLLLLADNYGATNGGIVSRQQIMQSLWPDTVVTDESISRVIADLRKYLGDSARNPKFINTISKQGYHLLVEPVFVDVAVPVNLPGSVFSQPKVWLFVVIFVAILAAFYLPKTNSPADVEHLQYIKTKLVVSGDSNRHPRIDSGGRYVVFDKMVNARNELWLYDVAQDTEHELFSSPSSNFKRGVFSQNGSELAYVESSNVSENTCQINLFAFKTQSKRTLAPCDNYWITTVDWMPEDMSVVATFSGEVLGTAGFGSIDIASGARENIAYAEQKGTGHLFHRVSPSGNKIAFIHFDAHNSISKIGVWDALDKHIDYVSIEAHQIQQVTWGVDDNTLLYSDIGKASSGLWEYDLQSGQRSLLINEPIIDFDISHSQHLIVGSVIDKRLSSWRLVNRLASDTDVTSAEKRLVNIDEPTIHKTRLTISANGKWLAYVSNRGGTNKLWLENTISGESFRVGQDPKANYLRVAFSKDGNHLSYLTVNSEGKRVLTVTNVYAPTEQVLTFDGIIMTAWANSVEDRLYVLHKSEGAYDISIVSLHDNKKRNVISGLPELTDFALTPTDNLITRTIGEKTLRRIKLNLNQGELTAPVEFNNSMFDPSFNIALHFENHWITVGGYVAAYFIDAEGYIFIQFFPVSPMYEEVDNIDLRHQNILESFTLTDDRDTLYYTNYSLPNHTLYKFSVLKPANE